MYKTPDRYHVVWKRTAYQNGWGGGGGEGPLLRQVGWVEYITGRIQQRANVVSRKQVVRVTMPVPYWHAWCLAMVAVARCNHKRSFGEWLLV